MQSVSEARRERGLAIAQNEESMIRAHDSLYFVQSQSQKDKRYSCKLTADQGWTCTCPDFVYRRQKCKHLWAVEISLALRRNVQADITRSPKIIQPINVQSCPACKCQDRIVKHGIRHNNYGDIQQFLCKNCGHTFVVNLGFERMKAEPKVITSAMQLYFSGESLRNTQKFLKLQGVKVSHVAILKWIRKYITLLDKYADELIPNVSDTWRTDELHLKIKGNKRYLYAIMDDETRFWIAQQVADTKGLADVREMFKEAKKVAQLAPSIIISDGARNFVRAIQDEFANHDPRPLHLRDIRLGGRVHNNIYD